MAINTGLYGREHQATKVIVQNVPQPKLVEKTTGKLFLLIRDDVSVNGKLYVAPIKAMTSMFSIKPEQFKERFDWYTEPSNRPTLDAVTISDLSDQDMVSKPLTREGVERSIRPKGGRPKGSKDKKPRVKRKMT